MNIKVVKLKQHANNRTAVSSNDEILGYGNWDYETHKHMECYTPRDPETWIIPFWIAITLKQTSVEGDIDIQSIRQLWEFREYNYNNLKARIEEFVGNPGKYEWILGDIELEKASATLIEILIKLKDRQESIDRADLVDAPIDETKIIEFKNECLGEYLSQRTLKSLIQYYSDSNESERCISTEPTKLQTIQGKDVFVEEWHEEVINLGFVFGRDIGIRENGYHSYWLESHISEVGKVTSIDSIRNIIQEMTQLLKAEGYEPNIAFIPQDKRFEKALTKSPDWDRKCPLDLKSAPKWIVNIENIQIFAWPHWDSNSIAVIDIGKFVDIEEEIHYKKSPLEFVMRPPSEQEIRELLESSKGDDKIRLDNDLYYSEGSIEKMTKIKMYIEAIAGSYLIIRDQKAAVKRTLSEENIGFAFDKKSKIFHKSKCDEIEKILPENIKYVSTIEAAWWKYKLDGCKKCHPGLDG